MGEAPKSTMIVRDSLDAFPGAVPQAAKGLLRELYRRLYVSTAMFVVNGKLFQRLDG
jgi:hypothetical protein